MPKSKAKPKPAKLSHFDATGQAAMVDVGAKQPTRRTATASAFVALSASSHLRAAQQPQRQSA